MFFPKSIIHLILFLFIISGSLSLAEDYSDSDITKVVMLGSGNPFPDPERSGPSVAIIVNDVPYLFDAGAGVWQATGAATGFDSYISWGIYDNARQTTNLNHSPLFANKSITEGYRGNGTTSTGGEGLIVDFLSNGFKLRQESAEFSGSNTNPIIFAAFADLPFSYARGR